MIVSLQVSPQLIALVIFTITYFFIATGWRERTIAAIFGATALWAFGILTFEDMLSFVNMDALGLLFGMMVIVGALMEAGFFKWLSTFLARLCRYNPTLIFFTFTLSTALLSAFLDNVTTVLFMVGVTIEISTLLKMDPKPLIISEILASNIGGTATLVGDPPNIIIATAAKLTFGDFLHNVAPITIVCLISTMPLLFYALFKKEERSGGKIKHIRQLERGKMIIDRRLFNLSLVTFLSTIALFFLHDSLRLFPSVIAVISATLLLFFGGEKMPEILERVEWSTLIFLACLFIVVGGLEKVGLIALMAKSAIPLIARNQFFAVTIIIWLTALASAIIDNVPTVATFIPFLKELHSLGLNVSVLWWALALGAGLGGNGTPVGASANVVALGIAKKSGMDVSFKEFVGVGMGSLIVSTSIANALLLLRMLL